MVLIFYIYEGNESSGIHGNNERIHEVVKKV